MKALVVLSHLMSKDCDLEVESISRAELAIEKFSNKEYDSLITIGWAYRPDCTTPIAEVVKKYILDNSLIGESSIISLTRSRDTVGDAFCCLDFFCNVKLTKLHIVTSDYHVNRTSIIFNSIFNNSVPIKVFGASTNDSMDPSTLQHEQRSLEEFFQTFKGVDFSSKNEIFGAISEKHPFYNGEIYSKISNKSFCFN